MGIDYVLPKPCRNREELGEAGLRRWTFLYMVHKYMQSHPDLTPGQNGRWKMPVTRGLSKEEQDFGREEIEEVGGKIGPYIARCQNCPANLDPKADEFGCVGRVNYPIRANFEEFIGSRVQRLVDRRPPEEWPVQLNLVLKRGEPFDGLAIARLRATSLGAERRLFEREETFSLLRLADGMNTNQIFHAFMGLPRETKDEAYSREIPREMVGVYLEFLSGVLYASLSAEQIAERSQSCSSYLQFRWLYRALRLAWKLELPVWMN